MNDQQLLVILVNLPSVYFLFEFFERNKIINKLDDPRQTVYR